MNYKEYRSNSNRKNKRATIDLANVVYDEEFVSLINSLSKTIKIYYTLTLNIIRDLYNNSLVIDNNSICSKCLINEINYNPKEKLRQLVEKIETISNTKKIFEKNILLVHSNLNKFFNDSKEIFQNLKNIRNSKINFAIDSKKYEKYGTNNSMINLKSLFDKNEQLTDSNENEKYYKNINSSINSEKPLSAIHYERKGFFNMKGNSTEIKKKNRLKSIYFNNNLTNNYSNFRNNDSFRIRNKFFNNFAIKKESFEKKMNYRKKKKNIKIGNLNNIFEFNPELSKSKSSYNNFYINQNSNINLNSNNINNINNNNNNLELSYKVIEFLSLLSNISKSKAKNNSNFDKMIQKFENTKKNLFELSKNFIEQSNVNDRKIYNKSILNDFRNENPKNNNLSSKEMKLLLMNNNIENITKGIEYKQLIDKIKYLSNNINKLQKQNKELSNINNDIKKELINNNLILSKKNNQLNLIQKEKSQYISQINVLKKDNEALMELIQEKNNKELNKEEKLNSNNLNLIKQKEKIINDLNKKINELVNKISEKDDETNILNNKIKELNDSLKLYTKKIKENEKIINQLQLENKNAINNNIIKQQDIKISNKYTDLIFEKSEEITFIPYYKKSNCSLNIEQAISLSFSFKKIKKEKINVNNEEIEKFKNKISELSSIIESKENEIKKYKNENSILKNFTKNKKRHEKEEEDEEDDENNKQILEQEIKKLKKENQNILEERNNLEINFKKLISDNKNLVLELDTKNIEIKKLENNVKELEDQIKEIQMKNIQRIYDEQNNNDSKKEKEKESESRNKKYSNLLQADSDINNEIINQLRDEIKEKENEIEYLKVELQELKSKAEENEDDNYDSMLKNSETNDKNNEKNKSDLEEKIKFLTERNEYYQKLYNEDKIKLQNLENINNNLKNEIEELKKSKSIEQNEEKNPINIVDKNENKIFSLKDYNILCNKNYENLVWYLLVKKSDNFIKEKENYDYDNLLWVPKINIIDIDNYKEANKENEIKNDDNSEKLSNKIFKNEINKNKEKEINFFNNFSFNNNSEELNKNKQNSNNNSNSIKPGSVFSLGNINIINEESNNDYNKLFEKYKLLLEKMSKTEESCMKLKKKNIELIGKIKKINKNNDNLKISLSEDSNNLSNANDLGKLSIVDNNFEGEGDIISKLNSKNEREQEYLESINIELEANKNQLKVVKEVFKELEKKFETVKKICENFFSRITLKKKEKEEIKILLKVMDFNDEQIDLIIDKKKK